MAWVRRRPAHDRRHFRRLIRRYNPKVPGPHLLPHERPVIFDPLIGVSRRTMTPGGVIRATRRLSAAVAGMMR